MQATSRPDAARQGATVRVRPGAGAAEARQRRRRRVVWGLLVGAAVLLVNAIVGENGYLAILEAQRTEATLTRSVATLRLENQRLQEERRRLETDPATLEEIIRDELGFIRPGETTIIVKDAAPIPDSPPR